MTPDKRTLLLILDGWGIAPAGPGNAVSLAKTPNLDKLAATCPHTTLACSGRAVGLPSGYMGNSEVGHMNIGAGRVVYQDMTRIDLAVETGGVFANKALLDLCAVVKKRGGTMHFMGLLSDGGVHSHIAHLKALLEVCKKEGVERCAVHAFLDGRDTPPESGAGYLRDLQAFMDKTGYGEIATVTGRFWAMDRDKRWDRVASAYAGLTSGEGLAAADAVAAVEEAYASGETDEFVKPRIICQDPGLSLPRRLIGDGDGVFFFNFRADRARELTSAFIFDEFPHFERRLRPDLAGFVSMTVYESAFPIPAAFPPQSLTGSLGEVFSKAGLTQLRLAETEKYAHVTYFLNCGREEPFPGEERALEPSPREVATYDLKPEMSVYKVCETFLREWPKGCALAVCNLANLDMVGHTGVIEAAVAACEAVDACVGRMVEAVLASGGRAFITADHGNAEEMIAPDGGKMTAHTTNPVPLILADPEYAGGLKSGKLGDIAPTILALCKMEKPEEMTGESLLTAR